MKRVFLSVFILTLGLLSNPAFSQTEKKATKDSTQLGLPGDNLDLYAVLDLFQKSKTIEEFEKSLNLEKTGINNMDLNLDKKVDFIKVVTKKKDDDFTFILQIAVSEKETQDVAVIFVSKDEKKKITMQIVGDKDLYGKDYIVELKESKTPPVTPNPGYTGTDTVIPVATPSKTTVVIVEQAPIVQYVYSPAYVPYYPPYYYGYYPPYFATFAVVSFGIYASHHAYYHHGHGGYGYHGNTTVIHNTNNFNNYNNSRNSSNTVRDNSRNGNYDRGNGGASTRPSNGGAESRPSAGQQPAGGGAGGSRPSGGTQPSHGGAGGSRPSAGTQPSGGGAGGSRPSSGTQPAGGSSGRPTNGNSNSGRPTNNASPSSRPSGGSQQSRPSSSGQSRYSGGGGGGSRGGGSYGGGSRGGGGRGGGGGRR